MGENKTATVAIDLMKADSREVLIQRLDQAMSPMEHDQTLAFLADLLLTLQADRDHLKQRLATLLANQFGRRSEKSSPDQLDLFAEILRIKAAAAAAADPADEEPEPAATAAAIIERTDAEIAALTAEKRARSAKERAARRAALALEGAKDKDSVPWPSHLPMREVFLPVDAAHQDCDDCGGERQIIRYETSWRMEQTTTTEVVVTRRPVAACPNHHGGPVTAPVPPKPVDKGQLGFSLASRLLWLRCTHNLPVRRLAEMLQAEGAPVSESMVHTLIRVSGERVKPLVEAIQQAVQAAALVNLDDTPVDVYEGKGKGKRKRRRARVWLALGDERFAYFFSTPGWKAEDAKAALGPITGVLWTRPVVSRFVRSARCR